MESWLLGTPPQAWEAKEVAFPPPRASNAWLTWRNDHLPLCLTKGPLYSMTYTLEHPLGETTLGSTWGHSLAWLSPFLFCFPPSFTGFRQEPSLNNPHGSNSSDSVFKESDLRQTLYCNQFLKMSLNLGYHSGTIAWDPFELCSQAIPHLCSLVMYDCSPFGWKTLSHLLSLFSAALCFPGCSLLPQSWSSLIFSSPSQPDSQTDLPICSDYSQNTPFTPALSENEILPPPPPLPRGHCCPWDFLKPRLLILPRYKRSAFSLLLMTTSQVIMPPPSY